MKDLLDLAQVCVLTAGGLLGLAAILAVIVSNMAADNPLRIVMFAFIKRLGLTGFLGVIDIPALAIEPLGGAFDIGSLIVLAVYWYGFFREARAALAPPPRAMPGVALARAPLQTHRTTMSVR